MDEQPSIAYSANGKMIGVRCRGDKVILIFDIASGVHIHSHSTASSLSVKNNIWTHGESFRFMTIHMETITIWEVGSTSDAGPTKVETITLDVVPTKSYGGVTFLLTPSRIAVNLQGEVLVWDAQNYKLLLCPLSGHLFYDSMSFSSDGRSFACSTVRDFFLWKESPTGYTLRGILAHESGSEKILLSPNGEWIVTFGRSSMRLWHPKDFTPLPPNYLVREPQTNSRFLLDFSPDGMLVAVARQGHSRVTILDIRSGVPQLTIDAGMEVEALRVNGNNTIAVADERKVVTWDLPTGDRSPDAKATLEDSTRKIHLRGSKFQCLFCVSISPDSSYVAITGNDFSWNDLHIHDTSTGERIFADAVGGTVPVNHRHFAPVGCNLLISREGGAVSIGDGGQVQQGRIDFEAVGGYPWTPSRDYQITNDWWIVDPDGKRLLMLPSIWKSHEVELRVWKGQFLALLHKELPAPVILELSR